MAGLICVRIRHPECQVGTGYDVFIPADLCLISPPSRLDCFFLCGLKVEMHMVHLSMSSGLGSITIVIDCNRLQLEHNRNCNRNQIFQIVA